jgi:hypothetical protein
MTTARPDKLILLSCRAAALLRRHYTRPRPRHVRLLNKQQGRLDRGSSTPQDLSLGSMVDSLSGRPLVAGRYALDRRIDTGELGSLWWATDRVTGRFCILCLVDVPPRGPGEPIRCSSREAMALAQVQCGQLVRMVEHGEWQGMPFFVLGLDEEDPAQGELGERHVRVPSSPREWIPIERLATPVTVADDSPPSTCRAVVSGTADSAPPLANVEAEQTLRCAASTVPRAPWKTAVRLSLLTVAILVVAKLRGSSPTSSAAPSDPSGPTYVPSAAANSRGIAAPVVSASASADSARAPASVDPNLRARSRAVTPPSPQPAAPRRLPAVPDYGI